MRITYLAHISGCRDPGVTNKLAAQMAAWRAGGHEVRAFVATSDTKTDWAASLGDRIVEPTTGRGGRLAGMTRLVGAIRSFRPELVYLRWDVFYPPMLWLPPRAALVVEINTDDLAENALGSRLRAAYNLATRRLVLGRANGLVFVTAELRDRPSFAGLAAQRAVVTNGIDLSAYPMLPAPQNDQPNLVFVGNPRQPWQGLDKVVHLARERPGWQFHVVGGGEGQWGDLPNVIWHGPLDRPGLRRVLARADVGLGTLALHRKSMEEACSLKVREYLAVGLPVVYANADLDLADLEPYVLRIANHERNVVDELDQMDAFVRRAMGVRVPRAKVAHLDVAVKEAQRLALFADLAGS